MNATEAKRGFALPAVLTVVTALTLVFLAALASLEGLRSEVRTQLATDQFQRRSLSAEARIAFFALTEPFGARSIHIGGPRLDPTTMLPLAPSASDNGFVEAKQELLIDGTPYAISIASEDGGAEGRLLVRAQDEAGLLNLNFADTPTAVAAFQDAGADAFLAETLADQLHDYTSPVSAPSLRGADADDYQRAGLAPPPGIPMQSWAQLNGLLALHGDTTVDLGRIRQYATVQASRFQNVNTASAKVIALWFNVTPGVAQDIVQSRETLPITDLSGFGVDLSGAAFASYYAPSGNLRLTFDDPQRSMTYRCEFELTPNDPKRPFWIHDNELIKTPAESSPDQNVADLPQLPDVPRPPASS
jgi:type II secretory pathway component PulK